MHREYARTFAEWVGDAGLRGDDRGLFVSRVRAHEVSL